jgi:hypothetical protein
LLALPARADNWAPNITTTAGWNINAPNADHSADQADALQLKSELLAAQSYVHGRDDTLRLVLRMGGEWWTRYHALTAGSGGARAEWQHKFGVNAVAPVLIGAFEAFGALPKESGRTGAGASFSLGVRKRFDDLTRGSLSHTVTRFDARNSVFDRTANESTLEIDRDLTDLARLSLAGQYRDGDLVSYALGPRPDLTALASRQAALATFGGGRTAYRIDARTWSARLALLRAVTENSAVILAYEWSESHRGSFASTATVLSLSLVHQY